VTVETAQSSWLRCRVFQLLCSNAFYLIHSEPLDDTMDESDSYTEWYDMPANDPYEGKYANLFRYFDAAATTPDAGAPLTFIANGLAPKTAIIMLPWERRICVVRTDFGLVPLYGATEAPRHHSVTAMLPSGLYGHDI
jgi:hypothetical protein